MVRNTIENTVHQKAASIVGNASLASNVLDEIRKIGVVDICLCPGGRNAPLVILSKSFPLFKTYYWFEERSAAFFALGRAISQRRPAAVVATSGSAVAELLPAAMESYYSGIPLLLVTADRPRRFRGSGAPQSAEQVGIFGKYALYSQDLAADESCELTEWSQTGPAHVNVCFEEPLIG